MKAEARLLLTASAGGVIWLGLLWWWRPWPVHLRWGILLLLLAPLVLVPLAFRLVIQLSANTSARISLLQYWIVLWLPPAALLVPISFLPEPGWLAAMLVLPWLLVTGLLAVLGVVRVQERQRTGRLMCSPERLCLDAGLIFIVVGGLWLTAARLGWRPLGFDPVIVLLTAIHFHYAGFLLPLLTGLAGMESRGKLSALASYGMMAGVPCTAMGITATQTGLTPLIETIAAGMAAIAGWLTAILYLRMSLQRNAPRRVRVLKALVGLSLCFSMTLAFGYALRFYRVFPWLDIPWMRALHGSANALGLGLAGVLAWTLKAGSGNKMFH